MIASHPLYARIFLWAAICALAALMGCGDDDDGTPSTPDPSPSSDETSLRSEYHPLVVTTLFEGLTSPWGLAELPNGDVVITERGGSLRRLRMDGGTAAIAGSPSVSTAGQGGLLDIVLHPNFDDDPWIYLTYAKPGPGGNTATALARGRLNGDALGDLEELFVQNQFSGPGRHYGSRIAWLPDGTLVMSIGDRGSDPPRAQDPLDHAGSIIRLNDDGSIPSDNPFVGDPDVADEIYSYGHRNIQGMVYDPISESLWASEHGPRGGDILHRVEPGMNYGWPIVTEGLDYGSQAPLPGSSPIAIDGVEPAFYGFGPTLAPSGLAVVTSERFSRWRGNLLVGGLRGERVRRLLVDTARVLHDEELFVMRFGRIRDVREAGDGTIFILTDGSDAALYRVDNAPSD